MFPFTVKALFHSVAAECTKRERRLSVYALKQGQVFKERLAQFELRRVQRYTLLRCPSRLCATKSKKKKTIFNFQNSVIVDRCFSRASLWANGLREDGLRAVDRLKADSTLAVISFSLLLMVGTLYVVCLWIGRTSPGAFQHRKLVRPTVPGTS